MLFNDYQVFIYVMLTVVVYAIVRRITRRPWIRNIVLITASAALILTLVKEHTLIVLAGLSVVVYVLGHFLQRSRSKALLATGLILVLSLFVLRNYPLVYQALEDSWLSFMHAPVLSVQKLGLSYILFRFVHFLVESKRGNIITMDPLTFLNYIFFFPTILAGPIDTYKNFHYWLRNDRLLYHGSLFLAGVGRILIGALKTLLIVPWIIGPATSPDFFADSMGPAGSFALSLLCYSGYIFIDFSGYSDIAIGSAYLLGIKTPENFNSPYISGSLSEFWKRWHITFSMFLRAYVFKPVIGALNTIINPKNRLLVTTLGYLITFFICGLWHGETLNFALWGLWHGVGLSINKLWNVYVAHSLPRRAKWYQVSSVAVTFLFVTAGWALFHYNLSELWTIYSTL